MHAATLLADPNVIALEKIIPDRNSIRHIFGASVEFQASLRLELRVLKMYSQLTQKSFLPSTLINDSSRIEMPCIEE